MNTYDLEDIKSEIKNICDNYKNDSIGGFIFGDGPVPCDILFVGEAPGKSEVEKGTPFIGTAGSIFEHYLNLIGYKRKNVRITNACYFRPINVKKSPSGKVSVSNRTPKSHEIELFRDILDKEINITNPEIIVTLGNIPLKRLTSFKSIGKCHGKLYFNEFLNKNVFPMYHPSALNYNRNKEFIEIYENDWKILGESLNSM